MKTGDTHLPLHFGRLQQIALDISLRFINQPLNEVDAIITEAINTLVNALGCGRGYLVHYSEIKATGRITHFGPDADPNAGNADALVFPVESLASSKIRAVSSTQSTSELTEYEKRYFFERGVLSLITVPIPLSGDACACLVLESEIEYRKWSGEEIELATNSGRVFAKALLTRETGCTERYQKEFNRLILEISTGFINLPPHQVDERIGSALKRIGRFLQARGAYLVRFTDNWEWFTVTHSWNAELESRLPTEPRAPTRFPGSRMAWTRDLMQQNRIQNVHSLDALPEEAWFEKRLSEREQCKSYIIVPLTGLGKGVGACLITSPMDNRPWTEDEIALLKIMDQIFTSALLHKAVEDERAGLVAELEAKNAELERFTYTVSHDLKSPLITIKGFLGYLKRDAVYGNRERMEHDIQRIAAATDKMKQLLDELLELSRIGRVVNPPEKVLLKDLVNDAVEVLSGRISKGNVQIRIESDLPTVHVDRPRMSEVIQNLLDNAVKYMGDQPRPTICVGSRRDGLEEVIYFKDNGIGIDAPYLEKVFGLFEKLDSASDGTGIGLALVKRIIEVHGGRVWVESEGLGKGCCVCFTLPVGENTHGMTRIPTVHLRGNTGRNLPG